jgi:hypothetical protein
LGIWGRSGDWWMADSISDCSMRPDLSYHRCSERLPARDYLLRCLAVPDLSDVAPHVRTFFLVSELVQASSNGGISLDMYWDIYIIVET